MRHDLIEVVAHHEPVAFEMPQGACKHPLRDPVHSPTDFGMTKLTVNAQRVDDAQRPAIAGMGQYLPPNAIVVVP
jgi:hypothetical protein